MQTVNDCLLRQTALWINEHPQHHNQEHWHCNTSHCFFGCGEMLGSNLDPSLPYYGSTKKTRENAQELFGLNDSQVDYLSSASRTLKELNQAVQVWTSSDFLNDWFCYPSIILALSPKTVPVELISKLAEDSDYTVRRAIAERPDLESTLISKLAKDSDEDVRRAIAEHHALPQ